MRKFLALSFLLVSAPAASAAEHGEPAEKPAATAAPNSVEMPSLIAPVVMDGKLAGYFYISSRLTATSASNAIAIREKLAFIQDAFVRDVNARPILVNDPAQLDRAQLGKRMVADAQKILGAGKITGIVFGDGAKDIGVKFSSLRPEMAPAEMPVEELLPAETPKPKSSPAPAHH
jgi:hypothetical protein